MSRLENAVQSSLTPLILGGTLTITPVLAELASRWSLKAAMVFDSIHRDWPFFTVDERLVFAKSETLPATLGIAVSLGRYEGTFTCQHMQSTYKFRFRNSKEKNRTVEVDGRVDTMTAGHLLLQVGSLRLPEDVPINSIRFGIAPHWSAYSRWIRPFRCPLTLGPSTIRAIEDDSFRDYCERWMPNARSGHSSL